MSSKWALFSIVSEKTLIMGFTLCMIKCKIILLDAFACKLWVNLVLDRVTICVKTNRKSFQIPMLFSFESGNSEQENIFKITYIFFIFPLCFLYWIYPHSKHKILGISRNFKSFCTPHLYIHIFYCFDQNQISNL